MSGWAIEDVLLIFSETETNATPPARKQLDQQDNFSFFLCNLDIINNLSDVLSSRIISLTSLGVAAKTSAYERHNRLF